MDLILFSRVGFGRVDSGWFTPSSSIILSGRGGYWSRGRLTPSSSIILRGGSGYWSRSRLTPSSI